MERSKSNIRNLFILRLYTKSLKTLGIFTWDMGTSGDSRWCPLIYIFLLMGSEIIGILFIAVNSNIVYKRKPLDMLEVSIHSMKIFCQISFRVAVICMNIKEFGISENIINYLEEFNKLPYLEVVGRDKRIKDLLVIIVAHLLMPTIALYYLILRTYFKYGNIVEDLHMPDVFVLYYLTMVTGYIRELLYVLVSRYDYLRRNLQNTIMTDRIMQSNHPSLANLLNSYKKLYHIVRQFNIFFGPMLVATTVQVVAFFLSMFYNLLVRVEWEGATANLLLYPVIVSVSSIHSKYKIIIHNKIQTQNLLQVLLYEKFAVLILNTF